MNTQTADYKLASADGGVDGTWYLKTYPDVAAAGMDPVEHYLEAGWREGRDPRADFSTAGYLKENTHAQGNPLLHYLRHGGNKIAPPEWQFAADCALASGHGGVDRAWYLQTYPDVAAAGMDAVEHYLLHGWQEARSPRADFSTVAYLRTHAHVDGNPLLHYLRSGLRTPATETACTDWYRLWQTGSLLAQVGQEPFAHAAFGTPGVAKILFTGHEASRTGAPLILLHLMQAIRDLTGAELYLLLDRDGPLLQEYQRIAYVLVNHNEMLYRPNGPDLSRMLASIAAPSPTLAICNCADGWRLGNALRAAGLPHLVSLIHERVVHYSPQVWRTIHGNSDRVIFSAQAVKAASSAVVPEFESAAVIPQGLLDPQFGRGDAGAARIDVRKKLGLSPDTAIVLGCGTRNMRKGIDLFVQLAARVRARTTRAAHFVWLGADPGDAFFARFVELDIALLNLHSTVSLVGEVAEPEPYFLAADAFALTSRDDPFPCVVHEAMACAVPVVAFDGAGGAKEAVADEHGIVVPYLDIEAMAVSLTSILEHPANYADLARRAEARVRSTYRFADYAEHILQVCESVTHQPMARRGESIARRESAADEAIPQSASTGLAGMTKWLKTFPARLGSTVRAEQWWGHKLAPMFAVFYATAYIHRVPLATIWPAALALLLAIAACAAYVSLVNDLTDRADDQRAGKVNRMAGRPLWHMPLLLGAPLCVAMFFGILWRADPLLVASYLGSWVAFTLYSLPPLRLKTRGIAGVIADACGSHAFPALTAALLALRAGGNPVEPVWIGTLVAWALGCGVRGILWHQLYDFEADRAAAVRTFVQRHSRAAVLRVARAALLIEAIGLALLLWKTASIWPLTLLLVYATFAILKSRLWNVAIVIAEPRGRYAILGQEYYTVLFPLGMLLACALRNPIDWTIVIAHCLVFSQLAMSFVREARQLCQPALGSG